MRNPTRYSLNSLRMLVTRLVPLVLLLLALAMWPTVGLGSTPAPLLTVEAPERVEVGEMIELGLVVKHARDIAGYEMHLLFDTGAAHFSGLHQRDNDLKKLGRGVVPLEAAELLNGAAIGLASCPYQDCVQGKGGGQQRGAQGTIHLATVLIGTDQPGQLEIVLENISFVDAQGTRVTVETPQTRLRVQVGDDLQSLHAAPPSDWQWTQQARAAGELDLTRDGRVSYADAVEVALEWTLGREQGQPCGEANDLSRDVNGDGCITVADIQLALAKGYSTADRDATPSLPTLDSPQPAPDTGIASDTVQASSNTLTFVVTSVSDAGDLSIGDGVCAASVGCTLRAAIQEANAHVGPDRIVFNISGSGVQTIQLGSRLPSLADSGGGTTIDGYSQPGAQVNTDSRVSNARLMVQLRGNGPSAFDAMLVQSAHNHIQGLAFFNFRRSIWFYGSGANDNVVTGSFIGTDATGTFGASAYVRSATGIVVEGGGARNRIGGTTPAERNVISGNARHGFDIRSEGTRGTMIVNNLVGLAPSGDRRLQNFKHGIDLNTGASDTLIGGSDPGARNIISGNGELVYDNYTAGVEISHDTLTRNNQVIGNCFGTEPTCTRAPTWAYNSHYGIRIEDGVNHNVIAENVIGNSREGGIRITHSTTTHNQIANNRIGISLDGTAIPNGKFGISIASHANSNVIGPSNSIAYNPVGVRVVYLAEDFNTITRNSIFDNAELGIDLGPYHGVNPNDEGDGDSGANEELNWPVLTSATTSTVTGTACAEAVVAKPCTIEVFIAERRLDDSGKGNYGQGKTFVGSGTTNADGSFSVAISGVEAGQYLTASSTDAAGNTSEFSWNIQVAGGTSSTPTPTSTPANTPVPTSTPTNTPVPTSTPTMTPTPDTSSEGLLLNPSFELDDDNNGPDNWSSSSKFTRQTDVVQEGSYSGRFYATDNSNVLVYQAINNLAADVPYTASGWVYIPRTSDSFTFYLNVQWRDANNRAIRTDTIKTFSQTSSQNVWSQASRSFLAPAGTSSAQVRLVAQSLNATLYVDNFTFFKDESATISDSEGFLPLVQR